MMNILTEMKSFSLRIGDSVCSLNKTQTRILILITSTKRYETYLNTRPLSPMKFSLAFFQLKLFKSENL